MASGAVKWLISTTVVVGLSTVAWAQEFDLGRYEYEAGCAACHGDDGKGGGPVAPSLTKAPANLTIIAKKNNGVFPLSAVYDTIYGIKTIVAHGSRDMPIWGFRYAPSLNPALIPKATDKYSVPTYEPEAVVRTRILAVIDYLNRIQEK
jgi:Cytochrome C oxidase, cbb3-type, subunit III